MQLATAMLGVNEVRRQARTPRMGGSVRSALLVLAVATMALGCSTSTTDDLLGERFLSITVERDGQPVTLVDGPVELEFENRSGDHVVRWSAGCNTVGGVFEITSEQLVPDRTSDGQSEFESTLVDCSEAHLEQDDWLTGVFASGPEWTMDENGTLRLEGDRVLLVLEQS